MPPSNTLILNFHGLGTPSRDLEAGEADYWIDPDELENVLDLVRSRADVLVTFDDGNGSDVQLALPALQRRGMRATFFLLAGKLGSPGYLAKGDVSALAGAGMRIGTHGMNHRAWSEVGDEEAVVELTDARRDLEAIVGGSITAAAFPFGAYNRRAIRLVRAANYSIAYTTDGGWADTRQWLQPRNTIRRGDGSQQVATLLERGPSGDGGPLRSLKLLAKRWR